jgi:predicted trehalose synthase
MQAAADVARRLGAAAIEPRLLMDANNVSIRLDPLRVVARVFSHGPFQSDLAGVRREVAIARHLAAKNAPIVPPCAELPAGPHVVGDLAVTLWQFMPHRPACESDSNQAAAALLAVHAALTDFPAALPTLAAQFDKVRATLQSPSAAPALAPADRTVLLNAHETIVTRLAPLATSARPVHGDAHLGNVLMTAGGACWTDFEAACIAPPEWDLGLLSGADPSVIGPTDPALVRIMSDLRSLGVAAWCWARYDQPEKREAAGFHLDRLKERAAVRFR